MVFQLRICLALAERQRRICPVQEAVVRRTSSTVMVWTVSGEEAVGSKVYLRICRFVLLAGEPVGQVLARWIATMDLEQMCGVQRDSCMLMSRTVMLGAIIVSDDHSMQSKITTHLRI